jgi:hypothetical protein
MHLSRYLWKSKSVRGDDCDRPGFSIEIIQWPVFFYGESKRCMVISDSVGILSDVLARDRVLSNGEKGGSHYLRYAIGWLMKLLSARGLDRRERKYDVALFRPTPFIRVCLPGFYQHVT